MDLARLIDHTLLKPDCTLSEIKHLCEEAKQYQFASVCVPPYFVKAATDTLQQSGVKVATVIGFPMGYATTAAKVEEIKRAMDEGATELDVVVNVAAIKNSDWNVVKNDIDSMTRAVHLKGHVIKVIIETALLTPEEIKKVCGICEDSGVNFVKTSTGYHGGASIEAVKLMRASLDKSIKIKASGGIRDRQTAEAMVAAGADRIGTSSGVLLVS